MTLYSIVTGVWFAVLAVISIRLIRYNVLLRKRQKITKQRIAKLVDVKEKHKEADRHLQLFKKRWNV